MKLKTDQDPMKQDDHPTQKRQKEKKESLVSETTKTEAKPEAETKPEAKQQSKKKKRMNRQHRQKKKPKKEYKHDQQKKNPKQKIFLTLTPESIADLLEEGRLKVSGAGYICNMWMQKLEYDDLEDLEAAHETLGQMIESLEDEEDFDEDEDGDFDEDELDEDLDDDDDDFDLDDEIEEEP